MSVVIPRQCLRLPLFFNHLSVLITACSPHSQINDSIDRVRSFPIPYRPHLPPSQAFFSGIRSNLRCVLPPSSPSLKLALPPLTDWLVPIRPHSLKPRFPLPVSPNASPSPSSSLPFPSHFLRPEQDGPRFFECLTKKIHLWQSERPPTARALVGRADRRAPARFLAVAPP